MRSWLLVVFGIILSALVVSAVIYSQKYRQEVALVTVPIPSGSPIALSSPGPSPSSSPGTPGISPSPGVSTSPNPMPSIGASPGTVDLTTDASGLSRATVVMITTEGTIKFKFYPADAPKTVNRIVELINKGFYNGLVFHRVIDNFVIQGGDPVGNGTGGSGQKIDAEFNNRKHVEGAVAMARAADTNSADSQFYICLSTLAHLDHHYTVFGQVIEGMDVVKKIKVGDKMMNLTIQ
jgi:peptidylprolyl isomerase